MTERLYYHDSYLGEFQARIVDVGLDRRTIYLDRTAFYPTSGGQPSDRGTVAGIPVVDVVDEDTRIAHILSKPAPAGLESGFVGCVIDGRRRADHREQHTGQHLLSAVFLETMGAETVSFHLGGEISTIDVARAALTAEEIERVEERANALVRENRPVTVSFGEASEDLGLRKATERGGTIRVVTIENLDRSACGGTHVRQTGEIGAILIRKLDKVRGNTRVEFVCGGRAVGRGTSRLRRFILDRPAVLGSARTSVDAGRPRRGCVWRNRRRRARPYRPSWPSRADFAATEKPLRGRTASGVCASAWPPSPTTPGRKR